MKRETLSGTWRMEAFLSNPSGIFDACIKVRRTEKQTWEMVQKVRDKHRGRTTVPVITPASHLQSCRETPGSTNGVRRWEKLHLEEQQMISGHLFYSFLYKSLLILLINLACV